MQRLKPQGDPRDAPRTKDERTKQIGEALAEVDLFPRRFSQALGHGQTITYAHLHVADVQRAAVAISDRIGWSGTEINDLFGTVAVVTTWPPD